MVYILLILMDGCNLSRNPISNRAVTTGKIKILTHSPIEFQKTGFVRCTSIDKFLPDIMHMPHNIGTNKLQYVPPNSKMLSYLKSQYILESSCKKKQTKIQVCDLIEYYTPQNVVTTKTVSPIVQSTCEEAIESLLEYATVHSNLISNPEIGKSIIMQISDIQKSIHQENTS